VHSRRNSDAADESLEIDRVVMISRCDHERDDEAGAFVFSEQREIFASGYTIVERKAIIGRSGGISDLRMSSLREGFAIWGS